MNIPFLDLYHLSEDKRIELICKQIDAGDNVGVLVDEEGIDGMEKANRYINKIKSKRQGLLFKVTKGPVGNVLTIAIRKES